MTIPNITSLDPSTYDVAAIVAGPFMCIVRILSFAAIRVLKQWIEKGMEFSMNHIVDGSDYMAQFLKM